jgi:hypothetical protein
VIQEDSLDSNYEAASDVQALQSYFGHSSVEKNYPRRNHNHAYKDGVELINGKVYLMPTQYASTSARYAGRNGSTSKIGRGTEG